MARRTIAVVVTFFGPLPFWMPAFLLSCRHNPDIRWLIYTDSGTPLPLPPNVEVKPMTLDTLNRRASAAMGTPVEVQPTYLKKLSDLKPIYGLIFADDLEPFDFWAWSELDVIWGDMRHVLTDQLLDRHDIVSGLHYKVAGHFTLFRNTPSVNRLFELVPDFRASIGSSQYVHIDERHLTPVLRARVQQSPPEPFPRVHWQGALTINAADQYGLGDGPADALWWRHGKTFDAAGTEVMYLHFHKLKKHMRGIDFGFDDNPAAFAITRNGIFAAGPASRTDRAMGHP